MVYFSENKRDLSKEIQEIKTLDIIIVLHQDGKIKCYINHTDRLDTGALKIYFFRRVLLTSKALHLCKTVLYMYVFKEE